MPNSVHSALVNPLEPSSCAACLLGPNALMPARVEIVDDAGRERRLRADHDEIDRVALAELDHRGVVGDIERDAFGFARDAGIARRAPEFRHQRGGCDLPRQSVFAAAGTEQENVHEMQPDEGRSNRVGRTSPPPAARGEATPSPPPRPR